MHNLSLTLTLLHITYMEEHMRTNKAGGLNGLTSAQKKKREEFT